MSLAPGTRIGAYEVLSSLGAGGMGEVYRAKDSKLKREVALKVLPPDVATDRERMARFQREAEVLASLNHPHIAQIYGLEESALVMELVEGEDLAERLKRGAIPLDEALPIAKQVAEALEAAHEQGIIHRDLKPANIKVRPDGTVKVLDFGLAKAMGPSEGDGFSRRPDDLANSPTITSPAMTMRGMILGTAAYMAPEQAKGKPVDKRADIWAFGVVLYEMLTGRMLFVGESTADVLGAVLRQDIDLAALPGTTPRSIRRLLRRCLERDPKQRLHDIADARIELGDAGEGSESNDGAGSRSATPRAVFVGGAIAILAVAAASLWAVRAGPWRDLASHAYHFAIPQQDGSAAVPAISPDGSHLVYESGGRLQIRSLDQVAARALEGTERGREPFWSPDSRSIGFFGEGALKRISLAGGPVETVAAIPKGWPVGTWSNNGTILIEITENPENEGWYVLGPGASSLTRIRAFAPDRPTNPDKAFPFFLPDGEHFLFTHPVGEVATLQVGTIRSQETRSLVPADSKAVFVPPDFVLYVRNGALLAQPFDPRALAMTGDAMTVIDDVEHFTPTGEAAFSASQEGTLVVRRRKGRTQLRWFNREGRATSTLLAPDYYGFLSISRNGQQLAVDVEDPRRSTQDLWVVDLGRSVPTRLTSSPRSEWMGRWSPDGSHLAFSADWEGPPNLYVTEVGGQPQVLVPFDRTAHFSSEWTPSGTHVVYARRDERFGRDLWMVELSTGERQAILATEFNEDRPAVSPNGQWLAYVSDASGRNEIYLRSFPKGTWQARLSIDGGHDPVWRQDGRELFYYEPSGAIMSVQIDGSGSGRPQASLPARLFPIDERAFVSFDVTADGQRFLLNLAEPGALSRPDEVIVNWLRMIKR